MIPYQFHLQAREIAGRGRGTLSSSPDAKLLAGGQTLIATMKMRLANPSELIDISGIKELSYIRMMPAPSQSARRQPTTRSRLRRYPEGAPCLAHCASVIGDPRSATKVRSADQWRTMTLQPTIPPPCWRWARRSDEQAQHKRR